MTNTQTPAAPLATAIPITGPSLAEKVDTAVHLFYVNDKDAGGVVQTEGSITDNPMMYLTLNEGLPIGSGIETVKCRSTSPFPRTIRTRSTPEPISTSFG